jgi:hypothetical protein
MKKFLLSALILCTAHFAFAQNFIPIPDTLSGASIDLFMADSVIQFYPGIQVL